MTIADPHIRLLTCADAALYRDIRLDGLRKNPEAFASTLEEEQGKPFDWFAQRIAQACILGAFIAQDLVGVAGLRVHDDSKQRHKATLWGMYVRSEARHFGLGERLIAAIVARAGDHVEQLQLAVVTENKAARRLYAKAGFVEYGHRTRALKQNGRYFDDVLMVKFLTPQPQVRAAE